MVGCAVARECALRGLKVTVLEKAVDFLDGASKANSAILHTGFDAPPGSLEQRCIASGYQQYLSYAETVGLPIMRTGASVIARSEEQISQLDGMQDKARENSVSDVQILSRQTLNAKIPHLAADSLAALHVPGEFVIDPWTTPYAYLSQVLQSGGTLMRDCELTGGTLNGGIWQLETSCGTMTCRLAINCAGLYGDQVSQHLTGKSRYQIKPRKGQFVVLDKAATKQVKTILLPIPNERTKGVVVCPTIFGNVLVGPTAEEQQSRSNTKTDRTTLESLKAQLKKIVPDLADTPVTAVYAGLRPATDHSDFQISCHSDQHFIDVGGIRSTGLSAALGIAAYVADQIEGRGHWPKPTKEIVPPAPTFPALAESAERDWKKPGNGGIICHCEQVTRREIIDALHGPLAATSLAGLKRRTRVTMGRCQGFYCHAELCELTKGKLTPAMSSSIP